jgi:gas vesicle protein
MGYIKGLGHGLALGLAIGVLTAPRGGRETREAISRSVAKTMDRSQKMAGTVQQGWQTAQPVLERAAQAAGQAARAVQPVAQVASDRFVELTGRSEKQRPSNGGTGPIGEASPAGFDSPS